MSLLICSLYNDIFALRGWKIEEINGIEFELNSILVDKWKGKAYRLVIQRQKRMNGNNVATYMMQGSNHNDARNPYL